MALKDIIGHDRALDILRGCIARERIPHALLFAGDEGIGKRLTAINFAKALNCHGVMGQGSGDMNDLLFEESEALSPESHIHSEYDACDTCPSCSKIDRGNHPDFFLIGPEGDAGQITVSAVRKLEESLSFKPFEGGWKVAVIDNADRLNPSAANAFLQTLEEPSPQSVLILISSRPDMLLATIRSRCQRINFSPLPVDTMGLMLEEKLEQFDREHAALLSRLSGGRLGYALNKNLIAQRDWSFDILKQMVGRLEDDVWDDRESMEEWFEWAQLLLRDIAVMKSTGRTDLLVNQDREGEIKAISRAAHLKDVLKLAREIYNIKRTLSFNLNKQLTLNYTGLLIRKRLGKSEA